MHEKLVNNLTSLENYCEKYIPLKMLNMIVECTEDSFKKKDAVRLKEVGAAMGEEFRNDVLADSGNPTLKNACLNLITKLRLENNILNKQKDGPA
jgi:hypothetical protein